MSNPLLKGWDLTGNSAPEVGDLTPQFVKSPTLSGVGHEIGRCIVYIALV